MNDVDLVCISYEKNMDMWLSASNDWYAVSTSANPKTNTGEICMVVIKPFHKIIL